MNRQRTLAFLVALPFAASLLVGCSQKSSSPTEPALGLAAAPAAAASTSATSSASLVSSTEESKGRGRGRGRGGNRGGNDDGNGSGRNRGGRGGNDDNRNPQPTPTPGDPRTGSEFEGAVTAVSGSTITLAGGRRIVVTASTQWSARGDLMSLGAVAGSVAAGDPTRVEGRGTRQADGAIVAATLKAEVDN